MMKSGTEYEIFCRDLVTKLKEQGDNFLNVQSKIIHDVHVVGQSTVEHQIDVYADYIQENGEVVPIIIECKDYSRNVSKDKIATLSSVSQDLSAKPVFMTKVGFQSGALAYAKYNPVQEVKTYKATRPEDADWAQQNLVRKLVLNINVEDSKLKETSFSIERENDGNPREEMVSFEAGDAGNFFLNSKREEVIEVLAWVNEARLKAHTQLKGKNYGDTVNIDLDLNKLPFIKISTYDNPFAIVQFKTVWEKSLVNQSTITVSADDVIFGIIEDIETGVWHIAHK